MSYNDCPECGAEMNRQGLTGTDFKGREVGVTWDECPECGTVLDEFGEVITPEDQTP